jgi:predicted nucleic acid-binding protein
MLFQSGRMKGIPVSASGPEGMLVIPTNDLWIASSTMPHGLKVLTTDKHYLEIPQIITEYFEAE